MKVKICGITTLADALFAARSGADMIGFNFWPRSKRYIATAAAAGCVTGSGRSWATAARR
ncbi:MAG: hypothetical protein HND48_06610 [Chloroflexi bacterium]|nr:hypothetical protein [Chloroflexota bacterium]